ncbi:TPA: carbohydrate binding domain-containing protein [Acinetobacter baumannii]|nr:carbohydrate binding domain-containing protein [Acinetobacter baumannii]
MEGSNPSDIGEVLTYLSKQVEQLTKSVGILTQQFSTESQLREHSDKVLGDSVQTVNDLTQVNSEAITNESVQSINRDTALGDRISALSNTQIEDKAYLVGEIERHHAEHSEELHHVNARIDTESTDRIAGEARTFELTQKFRDELSQDYNFMDQRVTEHDGILDTTTLDTIDFSLDSEAYKFDWSILSESQNWKLQIAEFFNEAEKSINDKLTDVESAIEDAQKDANQALENSDIDKILDELLGNIGSEFLTDALNGQLNDFAAQILQERQDRIQDVLNEANKRIEEIRDVNNKINAESISRVDAIAEEAKTRGDQIALEAYNRAQAIVEEANARAEAIAAEVAARNEAISAKAAALMATVDQTIKDLDDGYTKRFALVESANSKTAEYLEAYKLSNDKAVTATMTTAKQAITNDAATLEVVKAFRTEYDGNKATVAQSIKTNADANQVTAEKLETLRTDFNAQNKATGELIASTKAEINDYVNTVSDAQSATAEKLESFQATYQDRQVAIDGKFVELTKSVSDANGNITSTAKTLESKFTNDLATTKAAVLDEMQTQTKLIDGKIVTVSEKVEKLSGQYTGLSADLAKNVSATATAQETANTAVSATESLAQNLLNLKARTQTAGGVRAVVSSNGINDWTRWRTTGEATLVEDPTALGGYILQLGNNSGNDEAWVHWNEFVKIDPTKLYRVRARYRRVAGESAVLYMGVACKNADKTKYVTTTNTLAVDMGSSNYLQAAARPTLGEWQEVVMYMKGKSAGGATGLGTLENPRTFAAQAEYMAPMFIGNYTVQSGISQLNYVIVEDADSIASSNDATATAIDLYKVVTKENEATAERTGALESKVTGTEKLLDSTIQQVDENGKLIEDTNKKLGEAQATIDSHSKALTTFATKADLEKSEANQTTALDAQFKKAQNALAAATDSDSLAGDYNCKNPDMWYSHYGYDMSQYFKTTTTGKIGNTVFRKDTTNPSNCFNYNKQALPNTRAYLVSFLVRRSKDSDGLCNIPIGRAKSDGNFDIANYSSLGVPIAEIPADENWVLISKIVNMTSTAETYPQVQFGIAIGHTGTHGWWEVQGFRIDPILNASDVDTTIVKASVLVDYATKSDLNGAISSATTALTSSYKTYADAKATEVKSAVDANLTQNYYTKAGVDSAVSGGVEKFKASLTNGVIGGRNLLLNSKAERSGTNSSTSAETYLPYYLIDGGSLEPNTTYTVSGWFKKTANAADIEVFFVSNVGEHRKSYVPLTTENYTYFKYTFTTGPNTNQAGYVRVDNNSSKDGKVATVSAKLVKLEKGEYATDWTAAEGDLLGQISKVDATIRKDMYTKADTDSAIASGLTNFDAQFVLGGVNLFTGGAAEKKGTNEYLLYAQNPELSTIYAKGQVTISFDIQVAIAGRVQVYCSNGNPDYNFAAFVDVPNTGWNRMSVTVTPRLLTTGVGRSNVEFYGTYNTGRIVTVKNVKIEEGRKASAWSPSKGDIDAGFAGAIEEVNKVSANLSQNYYTKADANAAIANAGTTLEAKVNNNLSNTLKSYYNKTETDRVVATGLDEFNATLKVGGNNLLKNSNFANDLANWGNWGTATREFVMVGTKKWLHITANSTEYFKGVVQGGITGFEPNTDYVVSFDAYAVVGDTVRILLHQAGNGDNDPQVSLVAKVTSTPNRYSLTFKSANNTAKTTFNMHVGGENGKPYEIYIANLKFEVGNKATAWSESGFDTQAAASANATKYTDASVQKVDDKITSTATDLTKLKTTLGEVQNYTVSSAGFNNGWGGIKDLAGKVLGSTSRGFAITVFNGNNIASHTSYDTYGSTAAATNFVNAVNALADGTYVAITSYDAIGTNIATVIPALLSLGGSAATLKQVTGRDAYILIGRKGLGEGQGTELFSKTNGNLGGKQLDYLLQLVNGIPVGLGSSAPSAEAYNLLNTQVGEIDGRLTSASRAVTGLESSMVTVKKDIGTAQQTADTAKQNAATAQSGVNEAQQGLKDTNSKLSDTDLIARALTNGKLLFGDPTFKKGNNSVGYYDNAGTGRVKVERVAKEADNPTSSPYQLNVTVSNGASPSYGGFVQMYWARANAVFLIKYIIKLPVGFKLVQAANSMGVGAKDRFVGSTEGTGKYETYYRLCQCGATGPFSSGGHVYVLPNGSSLSGTETMTFQLAQIECYDLTDYSDMTPAASEAFAKLTEMANTSATEAKAMADKLTQIEASFNSGSPNGRMPDMRDDTRANLWTYLITKLPAGKSVANSFSYPEINTYEYIRKGEIASSTAAGNGTYFPETNALVLFRTYVYVSAAKTIKFTGIVLDDTALIYVNESLQYSKFQYGTYTDCSLTLALGWNKIDVFVANGSSIGGFFMNPRLETLVERMCPSKSSNIMPTTTASVLTGYTTQAEMNSAIATASTTIKSEVKQDYQSQFDNIKLDRVTIPDTRSANSPPSYYWDKYPRSVVTEFKSGSSVGSPGGNTGYGSIETLVPWNDASGGPIIQKWSSGPESNTRYRQSVGSDATATWGPWSSDLADTKVKLTEQAQVINGIQAVKSVSIDNNGVLCGYALTSELVNGVVRTAFGVDVDTFYVGKPGDNKKFFSIVNGVTAINDAIIGNLSASKITTGQFTGDRIAARTLKADHLSAEAIDAIAVSARNVTITASDGSKTVQTGGLTEIFYPNGQLGIRLGIK